MVSIRFCQYISYDFINIYIYIYIHRTLLQTVMYLEDNVMSIDLPTTQGGVSSPSGPSPSGVQPRPSSLDVYLFLWNRYRMVAKDFILQNYRLGGRLDKYCVESHERMVRYHIMMDHQMQWSGACGVTALCMFVHPLAWPEYDQCLVTQWILRQSMHSRIKSS